MKNRENFIDLLKGIAILLVIVGHTGGYKLGNIIGLIGKNSYSGVIIFFVISGYLSFYSIQRSHADNNEKSHLQGGAYWILQKLMRIVPVYYLSILLGVFLGGYKYWLGSKSHVSLANIFTHIIFVNEFFPYFSNSIIGVEWYISDLVLFLFMAPLLFIIVKQSSSKAIFIMIILFVISYISEQIFLPVIVNVDQYVFYQFFSYTIPIKQFPYFMLGLSYANIKSNNEHTISKIMEGKDNFMIGLSVAGLSFFLYYAISLTNINTVLFVGYFFLALAWFLAFVSLQIYCPQYVIFKAIAFVGRYSLGIYLFHLPINAAYEYRFGQAIGTKKWFIQYVVVVILSIIVGWMVENGMNKMLSVIKNILKNE